MYNVLTEVTVLRINLTRNAEHSVSIPFLFPYLFHICSISILFPLLRHSISIP